MLIQRYLLKEILTTFSAVVLVVLLIAISNKFVRLVAKSVSGEISPEALFTLLALQIPDLLAFLFPIALFLAIILSFGKLYADNEFPVMLACGIAWQSFLKVSFLLALGVMLFSAVITCYIGPHVAQIRETLLHDEGPLFLARTLSPGKFHSLYGRYVFYVADLSDNRKELQNLFVAEAPQKGEGANATWQVVTAKRGKIQQDSQQEKTYLVLNQGNRYRGEPDADALSVIRFEEYQKLLEEKKPQEGLYYHRTMPTPMLLKSPTPGNMAELQWRLSLPLSVLLLTLAAVPLSRLAPRQGRYHRLFVATLICIVYYNLLTMSKRWVAMSKISPLIGVWWVHVLLVVLGLGLLAKASGRGWQMWGVLKKRFQ